MRTFPITVERLRDTAAEAARHLGIFGPGVPDLTRDIVEHFVQAVEYDLEHGAEPGDCARDVENGALRSDLIAWQNGSGVISCYTQSQQDLADSVGAGCVTVESTYVPEDGWSSIADAVAGTLVYIVDTIGSAVSHTLTEQLDDTVTLANVLVFNLTLACGETAGRFSAEAAEVVGRELTDEEQAIVDSEDGTPEALTALVDDLTAALEQVDHLVVWDAGDVRVYDLSTLTTEQREGVYRSME